MVRCSEVPKRIYQSATAEEAAAELEALDTQWGDKYRAVVRLWRGNWDNIIPFFQFVPQIRKVIYTTNAIESLNMVMRKLTRNRRIFPNDDSALKSLFWPCARHRRTGGPSITGNRLCKASR